MGGGVVVSTGGEVVSTGGGRVSTDGGPGLSGAARGAPSPHAPRANANANDVGHLALGGTRILNTASGSFQSV
jgi:hypothetical protein